jgi:hypothetical protein
MTNFLLGIATTLVAAALIALSRIGWRNYQDRRYQVAHTITITTPADMPAGEEFTYYLLQVREGTDTNPDRKDAINKIAKFRAVGRDKLQVDVRASTKLGLQFKCFVEVADAGRSLSQYETWMAPAGWVRPRFDHDINKRGRRIWFLLPDEDYGWVETADNTTNNFLRPAVRS